MCRSPHTLRRTIVSLSTWLGIGAGLAIVASAPVLAPNARGQVPVPSPSPSVTPQTTALLVTATNAPLRVPGSDGMELLLYDVVVTNFFSAPATLTEVEVLAPDGPSLLDLAGEALAARTQSVAGDDPTAEVPAGGVATVRIDLVVPPGQVLEKVSHRLSYDIPADAPGHLLIISRVINGPELSVDPCLPIVIAAPLHGNGWISANPYHRNGTLAVDGVRYVKPELFAVDWSRLEDGRFFAGDGARPEQWFAYGSELVAVADGTVVFVNDGIPNDTPGELPTDLKRPVDYAGNQVVIQIRPDVWATYAHMQPGSIQVRVGEHVVTGQVLGKLGGSGNSTGPHVHFQLSDGPPTADVGALITANSLSFVLDRYTLAGTVDLGALIELFTAGGGRPAGELTVAGSPQAQAGTFPLPLTVVDFP